MARQSKKPPNRVAFCFAPPSDQTLGDAILHKRKAEPKQAAPRLAHGETANPCMARHKKTDSPKGEVLIGEIAI
jgi:hypothetical protein